MEGLAKLKPLSERKSITAGNISQLSDGFRSCVIMDADQAARRLGLAASDIDPSELNEAYASQTPNCRDTLGIDPAPVNAEGGIISIGHPFGMTGSRMTRHALLAGRRLGATNAVMTVCIDGAMRAAALFEISA